MLVKSIRVSARKQPDAIYPQLEEKLLKLASQLLRAAQADSDAFAQYIRAMQLQKTAPPSSPHGMQQRMTQVWLRLNRRSTS